uniref:tRNA(Ile)-lysidine synthase n=1 Tax=OCS116 cluster bacterium TaxID=2030921 RepID=A0A2A4Z6G1_9PROT
MTVPDDLDQKIQNVLMPIIDPDDAPIAVAVSGGGDSMALLLALHHYRQQSDITLKIIALTVDHKLRADAAIEAAQVGQWCKDLGIEHHVLEWQFDEMPTTAIQEKARDARYQLMGEFCVAHHINKLFVAHNLEDNAETFLMRLKRGAGLSGLSGIAATMQRDVNGRSVDIVRPFLTFERTDLRDYLSRHKQLWYDDVSNQNEKFERVQIRNFLAQNAPLNSDAVAQSAKRLARANEAVEFYLEDFWQSKIAFLPLGIAHVKLDDFAQLPEELKLRLLARLVWTIGGQDNPPRWQKIENLLQLILGAGRQFCLGHCLLVKKQNGLWFGYEDRDGQDAMWAGRFENPAPMKRLSAVPQFADPLLQMHDGLNTCPKVVLQSIAVVDDDDEDKIKNIELRLKIRR